MKCVNCKNWKYDPEKKPLSDVTPGQHAEFRCTYDHFYFLGYSITTEIFRETLHKERKCNDFEKYEVK